MTKAKDDLEAVREIADLLKDFDDDERERILRWSREKLGMPAESPHSPRHVSQQPAGPAPTSHELHVGGPGPQDIRSFVKEKDPKNDGQLAAVVAYFHQFVAPDEAQKSSIGSDDLIEACRQADRTRPTRPAQTLVNAFRDGLLDRAEHGRYSINSVGENLVAMVLPGDGDQAIGRRTSNRRPVTRKPGKKKQKKIGKAKKKRNRRNTR